MSKQLPVEPDDANIEVGDVEVDACALVAPANPDVHELRVVAQRDLAAGVHLSVRTLKGVFATDEPGRAFSTASKTGHCGSPTLVVTPSGEPQPFPKSPYRPRQARPVPPITVGGEGYTPGEQVNVTYKTGLASASSLPICISTANPDDTFSCTGDIPTTNAGANGAHKIKVKGISSFATAKNTFTLT
jgi:hypothetical protein